jgi:polyisoprenoid-binding protein YceI
MDPAASRLAFRASYQGQAAPGVFREFDARLRFDPARSADNRLDVTVKLASADMGSGEINDGIREPEWLHPARFPEAEFHASDIRPNGPDRYVAVGTLRVKGVERNVEVPFTLTMSGGTADMAGEVTLDRTAFGIGTGEWASGDLIGLDVKLTFNLRLRRVD